MICPMSFCHKSFHLPVCEDCGGTLILPRPGTWWIKGIEGGRKWPFGFNVSTEGNLILIHLACTDYRGKTTMPGNYPVKRIDTYYTRTGHFYIALSRDCKEARVQCPYCLNDISLDIVAAGSDDPKRRMVSLLGLFSKKWDKRKDRVFITHGDECSSPTIDDLAAKSIDNYHSIHPVDTRELEWRMRSRFRHEELLLDKSEAHVHHKVESVKRGFYFPLGSLVVSETHPVPKTHNEFPEISDDQMQEDAKGLYKSFLESNSEITELTVNDWLVNCENMERLAQAVSDAGPWLEKARAFSGIHDWKRARDCATKAITMKPSLVEAYMIRALACRITGDLDEAIRDYSTVIETDPQHGEAWMYRGAARMQKASSMHDQSQAMTLLNDAHLDYKRAAELMPDNEQTRMALLELEICSGKYREAANTAEACWNQIHGSPNNLICAWLAGIAFILAGKPAKRWVHFCEFLDSEPAKIGPTEWSVAEIGNLLKDLDSRGICDADKLHDIQTIHGSFLRHFSQNGPEIMK
jgi:tetratricopeptide (TPR) repeat protein